MIRPSPMRQARALVAGLAFLLAACGGGGSPTSDSGSSAAVPTEAPAAAPDPEPARSETSAASAATDAPPPVPSSLDHCEGAHRLMVEWVGYIFDVGEGANARPRLDAVLRALAVQAQTAPPELRVAHENAVGALTRHGEMLEAVAWDPTALTADQFDELRQFDIDGVDPLEVVGEHYRESCGIDIDAYAEELYAERFGEELSP